MIFPRGVRLLPLLIAVAALSLIVRLGEFAAGFEQIGVAFAQQEATKEEATPPPLPGKDADAKAASAAEQKEEGGKDTETEHKDAPAPGDSHDSPPPEIPAEPAVPEKKADGEAESKNEWKDAGESEFEYSELKEELYKDLVSRREQVEKREQALAKREALLEAAGRELDQKIREMTAVRNEIEGMLKAQSEQEQAQIASLVRIYEGMKAKDAARIFDTLDMDVLISVLSRMSERKSAPILAEMSADRARSVTILMAQQKQIPAIPPQ